MATIPSGQLDDDQLTQGSFHYRAAKRVSDALHTYAPNFPVMNYNTEQEPLLWRKSWDGRSTGYLLQSPNAEQARNPLLIPTKWLYLTWRCIAYRP